MEKLTAILTHTFMDQPVWVWGLFLAIVITILVLDLFVLNRKAHEIKAVESLKLCSLYVAIACLFGGWIAYSMGKESALEYFTGYLVEFSLSIDNIFVISLIFSYFAIPRIFQHRVLFWGILGAIVLRGCMIIIGAELVAKFAWILYIFGAFLLFSGIKMLLSKHEENNDMADNRIVKFVRKYMNVTDELNSEHFFVKKMHNGKMKHFATPLFLALIIIEISDIIFAVDSIPAIFVITQHAFIVFSSNIFAILGLRSLYFLLAAAVHRFQYLKHALSLVLIFIGSKIFVVSLGVHIPAQISLLVTLGLLSGGVFLSLYKTRKKEIAE
ncbi:MAG: TerC family protein [Alphaproteobacteria bacterium]|nr:TerC family protein [Alphaproteobacteria bacterium]